MHLWWLVLLAFPLLVGFGAPRVVDSAYTPAQKVRLGETANWQLTRPDLSATAYLLYDMDANYILLSEHANRPLAPASLTKLMTALLVLEADDLESEVMVVRDDLVGGTAMGLVAGEMIRVDELLWGLLIPSGNDAAMTLARYMGGGSVDNFVAAMNQRARALGLTETHFVNPHGLDADGHVSSAADMLVLVKKNWDYPLFREIVRTTETMVNGHLLRNTNQLLGTYEGTNGIKTGTTDAAGQCLIAGFQQNGHEVVGIVLGSSDRYTDMRALHRHYLDNYHWLVAESGSFTTLDRLQGMDGKLWYIRPQGNPPTVFMRMVEREQLVPFRRLSLPVNQQWEAGMEVGTLEWRYRNSVIGTQPMVLW
ncbi:MAG: D-alanyl-D-alanine carboxypeptidase [Caldilineaceae bacterium]|nr:D-alanyl-D-alanine carboxypeptidase [Caldilineaceae bacterium]